MAKIIIHGGCGARESAHISFDSYHQKLLPIIKKSYAYLSENDDAINCALFAARLLEDEPIFNAGTGSRVQQDGEIRMSASIMDSIHNKFAAVINIQDVEHPIDVAYGLLKEHHSVLAGEMATKFAREQLKIAYYNPMTKLRYEEYLAAKSGKTGTIGVVVIDSKQNICAITSTGGVGFETPGRVGDSASVAGNYASSIMGISCTGVGEDIVNQAVAAKIHTRVQDGMLLKDAIAKSIGESNAKNEYVGLIALDNHGNINTGSTNQAQTLYAYHDGINCGTFFDNPLT